MAHRSDTDWSRADGRTAMKPDPPLTYEFQIKGHLDNRRASSFDGQELLYDGSNTILRGPVTDQAALHGLLAKFRLAWDGQRLSLNSIGQSGIGVGFHTPRSCTVQPSTSQRITDGDQSISYRWKSSAASNPGRFAWVYPGSRTASAHRPCRGRSGDAGRDWPPRSRPSGHRAHRWSTGKPLQQRTTSFASPERSS